MYYFSFLFFVVAYILNEKKDMKIPIVYMVLPFFIINFIKYGAGTDYFSYNKIYDSLSNGSFLAALNSTGKVEVGYRLTNILASKLGMNFTLFSALFMSLISYFSLKWIFEDSKKPYLSLLLFFSMFYIYWNLSALRHGLVLVVLTYIYFSRKNEFNIATKILVTILMFTFHKAALIVPVFYLISKLKWKRIHFILLLVLAPLSRIFTLEPVLLKLSEIPIASKFVRYLDYNSIRYLSIPSLQRLFFVLLLLVFYNKLKQHKNMQYILNYALANLIVYFYLPTSMVVGTRITIFGYYTMVIIIPEIAGMFDTKRIKTLSVVGLNIMSVIFFINELDKQKENSMYNQSIHKMNFETVFNKNLDHYSNAYALDYQVERVNMELETTSDIFSKMKEPYELVGVDENDVYLSVKFLNNDRFGIINKEGEVVLEPILDSRVNVYGPYYRIHNDELFIKNYTYFHITNKYSPVNYKEVASYVEDLYKKNLSLSGQRIIGGEIDLDILNEYSFLDKYDLSSVLQAERYHYEDNEVYSYVRLATKYSSYYMILFEDVPIVDKLYKRVLPVDEKGIITGFTHSGKEYIDADSNQVIWYEGL